MHFLAFNSDWGAHQDLASSYTGRWNSTSSGQRGATPDLGQTPNRSDRFRKSVKPVSPRKANYSPKQVRRVKSNENVGSSSSQCVPVAKGIDPSHEDCKYEQPKRRHSDLARIQKRRLQRLRSKKRSEQESRKEDSGTLIQAKPMTSPRKEWKPKVIAEPKVPTPILVESISTAGLVDCDDAATVETSKYYPCIQVIESTYKELSPSQRVWAMTSYVFFLLIALCVTMAKLADIRLRKKNSRCRDFIARLMK